jgi:hypothetical protein
LFSFDEFVDAAKPRKTRGGAKSSSKKDAAASQEPIQPGAIRIMAPKSPAAAAAGNAATQQPSNGTDAKNKSNKKAAAASGGGAGGGGEGSSRSRGKGRGSERVPKEVKPADASGGVDNNGNGEAKNPRRRDSRASAPGAGGNAVGKKDNNAGRGDRVRIVFCLCRVFELMLIMVSKCYGERLLCRRRKCSSQKTKVDDNDAPTICGRLRRKGENGNLAIPSLDGEAVVNRHFSWIVLHSHSERSTVFAGARWGSADAETSLFWKRRAVQKVSLGC